ncbi:proteasome activator complex subunit 3 [Trichonephila clavipes]|nr:proteasome activator complex subunit 3 [Trichonephila clavipes]
MEALYLTAERFKQPNAGKNMVNEYKDKVKLQAENLVLNQFPQKILELEALLKTEKFTVSDLSAIHCELNIPVPEPPLHNHETDDVPSKKRKFSVISNDVSDVQGTKVLLLPNGTVPSNSHIVAVVELVKPRIQQLVEDANVLKMWIQFLIPRIEDGNNFGVSIQEDTLGEIRTVESEAAAYFDQISRYFLTRGKIVSKVAKYPHVDDFRRTVSELDEKEFLSMRLIICELRNHYATLHDLITKNLEKIKKPRTSNADTMY